LVLFLTTKFKKLFACHKKTKLNNKTISPP
jgi:hypothetical protein